MAKGIFITGSGTGVGKTYVSALLLKGFSALGFKTTYMKPVETGCGKSVLADGKMPIGADTAHALKFASCKTDINLHSPYRFLSACSPHLAARMDDRVIGIDDIVLTYEKLNRNTSADVVIVEGAGGVLVPVNDKEYVADVIRALGIPSILVVDSGLGTLNHTFLSLRALVQCGIPVIGIVINNARNIERDFVYEDNVIMIRQYAGAIPCVEVEYSRAPDKYRNVDDASDVNSISQQNTSGNPLARFCNEIISRA